MISRVADIHTQTSEGQSRTHWLIVVAWVLGRTYPRESIEKFALLSKSSLLHHEDLPSDLASQLKLLYCQADDVRGLCSKTAPSCIPGIQMRVTVQSENGRIVQLKERGDLEVTDPVVSEEYFNNEVARAEVSTLSRMDVASPEVPESMVDAPNIHDEEGLTG